MENLKIFATAAGHISVAVPFSREFNAAARSISGRWDASAKVWVFDSRDRKRLTEILYEFFGYVEVIDTPHTAAVSGGDKKNRTLTPPGVGAQADAASTGPASAGVRHTPPGVPAPGRRPTCAASQVSETSFVGSGKGQGQAGTGRARRGGRSKRKRA